MPKTSIKVLLIEDNPADALLLEESLSNDRLANFQMTVAERLKSGLEKLKSEKFDILLLDLGLPDSQGMDTFETAHAQFPAIPTIVLSGIADELLALQAVQAGAQDYLVKGESGWNLGPRAIRYAIERFQTQTAMRASEARFSTVFHSSPTCIAITRLSDNQIVEVNEAWTEVTGYSSAEVIGRRTEEFNLWVNPEEREKIIDLLRRDGMSRGFEFKLRRKSGQICDMLFSGELIELDGEPCMLSMALDITERKRTERVLVENEVKLKEAEKNANLGYYDIDIASGKTTWSEETYRIFGLDMAEYDPNVSNYNQYIHQDDMQKVFDLYDECLKEGKPFDMTYRIVRPNGEIRHVHSKSTFIGDEQNNPTRLFGTIQDVTERKQDEAKIYFQSVLLGSVGQAVIATDLTGTIIYFNRAAEELYGWSVTEALGRNIMEVNVPAVSQAQAVEIMSCLNAGETWSGEFMVQRRDGTVFPAMVSDSPVEDETGKLIGIIGVSADITARKAAEEQLRKLSRAVEQSPASVVITDIQGNIEYVNPKFTEVTGYSLEEALGQNPRILKSENTTQEEYKKLWDTITSGNVWQGELLNKKKNGDAYWEFATIAPVFDDSGKITNFLALKENITARKQAEDALRESEASLQRAQSIARLGSWNLDLQSASLSWSAETYRIFGAPLGMPLTGEIFQSYIHPDDRDLASRAWQAALQGQLYDIEHRIILADGQVKWVRERAELDTDAQGNFAHVSGTVQDITERKLAQEKIARTEKRSQALIENAPDGVVLVGLDGKYKYASPTALKIFNYKLEDISSINPNEQTHPDDLPMVLGVLQDLIANPSNVPTIQYRFQHQNDEWRWIESTFTNLLAEPSVEAIVINFRDITERKLADEKLRENEEHLRLAYDAAELGFWREDISTRTSHLDKRACKHYDVDETDVSSQIIFSRAHPEDLPRLREEIGMTLNKNDSDGRLITEYRVVHRDGSIHWLAVHARLYFEEQDGKRIPVFGTGTTQDITARKDSEQKLTQRTNQLRLINEATRKLNASLKAEHVYEVIYASVSQLIQCDTLFISAFDTAKNMITLTGGWHDGLPLDLSSYKPIPLEPEGSGTQSQVIRTKQPLLVPDFQARLKNTQVVHHFDGDGKLEDTPPEEEDIPRSALVVPLVAEDEVFGVIQVFSYRINAYTEDDLQILSGFSAQAAIALSNARLYENIQQENLERKRAEEALQTSESKYRALVENIQVGVVVHNSDSGILFANPKASQLLGLTEDQLLGKTAFDPDWHFIREDGTRMPLEEYPANKTLADAPLSNLILGIMRPKRTEPIWVQCNTHSTQNSKGQIQQVIVTFNDITERKQTEENIRQRVKALELLYESGLIFSQLLNPKEIAKKIIELLAEKLDWHHTVIRLVRPQDQSLELLAFDQPGVENPTEEMMVQTHLSKLITGFDKGLTGWALQQSKIVRGGDVSSDPRYVASFPGINSGLYVPLKSGDHLVGVISIESENPDAFSQADEHLIATLASQAANAFENARLYEESTRYASELEERVQERTAEIESTRQRLELAVKTAGIGIWELDIKQNKDYWDAPLFALYGLTKENTFASPVTWHNVLHPDDLEQQLKLMDEAVHHKQPYNTEFRVIWPDKSIHYIKSTGVVVYDAAGLPERMIGANQDITIDKQAEETLRFANAEMERGMRMKNEFLANMSHELRTPLNAILGISESLEEQIAGTLNEKQLKYVRIVGESGHHLLDLINDILDLSKIEAGKLEIDIQSVSVEKLCSSSLRLVKELAQKKSLHISFKIDENVKIILGDERRLKQSLVNLLGNAVKFTPQGKKIGLEVCGDPEKNEINFIVWDEGIGINQEDIKLLFRPFVQLNAGFTREFSGTGLGLALVSQMIRLHGGRVTLTSELKVGSRFTITLPWMPTEQGIRTPIKPQVLADNHQPRVKRTGKILLAEDTEVVAQLISEYLKHMGYEVSIAQNGWESVVLARQEHPQLILMDIMMPVMNGLDAARLIRADAALQNVPIIALTALAMPGDREQCIAAGMNDHVSKPIQMQELAQIIEHYLNPADESQTS